MGQVTVTLTGDEARLLQALDRVITKERELGRAGQEASRDHVEGGDKVVESVEKIVASYTPWTAALAVIKMGAEAANEAAERLNRTRDAAGARLERDAENLRKLAQVSGGDPAKFAALNDEARANSQIQGISVGAAAGQLLELERAGITGKGRGGLVNEIGRIGMDPKALVAAQSLQKSFGADSSTESLGGVVNAALQLKHPGDATEFLEAAARAAPMARKAGLSENEFLSDLSQVAQARGSERGGHELAKLLDAAAKHPGGGGLAGLLKRGDRQLEHLAGPGGFAAAKAIQSANGAQAQALDLSDTTTLGSLSAAAERDPTLRAVNEKLRAQVENENSLEGEGRKKLKLEQFRLKGERQRRAGGMNEMLNEQISEDEAKGHVLGLSGSANDPRFLEYMKIVAEKTTETARNARPQNVNPDRDK